MSATEKSRADALNTTVGVISLLSALGAAALGYIEYKAHQQEVRVERVLQYSATFRSAGEGYRDYADKLDAFSRDYWAFLSNREGRTAADFVVGAIKSDAELRKAVTVYTKFFDTLTICVSEGLCDEHTARALFTHDLAEFHNLVRPWLEAETQQYGAQGGKPLICLHQHFRQKEVAGPSPIFQIGYQRGPCREAI